MTVATHAAVRPSIALAEPKFTPDDLVRVNGPGRQGIFELVDGKLVRKPMSLVSKRVAGRVAFAIDLYLRDRPLGEVFPEQEFQCFPDRPAHVRIPDVAFVLSSRLPTPWPRGYPRFIPDLAVEVVSPTDLVYNLDEKLEEYRSVDFPLIWVVDPDSRLVRVHAPGQPVVELRDGDVLRAEGLLPGLAVPVSDVMLAPTAV